MSCFVDIDLITLQQLVLNEQYMVLAHDPHNSKHTRTPITNRVIKALSKYGSDYKTFGENIILLLNRESKYIPNNPLCTIN